MSVSAAELDLADLVAECHYDPLRFVLTMFPWGEPGALERYDGPDDWQRTFLVELGAEVARNGFDGYQTVDAVRRAVSSGHGVGKSVLVGWLVCWIMSTRPHAQGVVTANTSTQLETKTWAAVQKWVKLCLTGHWFEINTKRMYHKAFPSSWFCTPQTCREENSEAFAGQHAADSTSFYIFDEASAVPDSVQEVAEGGLTDGEPMIFKFGNPTRSYGKFHYACFGAGREEWHPTIVDSRTARFTNKRQLEKWIEEHGLDSDFVRVRIFGLPPRAGDLQYIGGDLVFGAQRRVVHPIADEPLVCGLDVARGGADYNVFWFRRGPDARSIPPIKIPGEQTRDSMKLVTKAADVLDQRWGADGGQQVAMLFIDGTGIGGPIADRLVQLGYGRQIMEIQFGSASPDPKFANMRSYMWGKGRDWLARGAIPPDPQLEQDLTGPGYEHDRNDRLFLESKEDMKARDLASPDMADALFLTFAATVRAAGVENRRRRERKGPPRAAGRGWSS
jgi:hypothetical protein